MLLMKKYIFALIFVLLMAVPAFAVYSSKGQIPNGEPIEYKGLKVTQDGVNIILVNKGDKAAKFSASCSFTDSKRREIGDFFIEEITIEPSGRKEFTKLYLKGDARLCKAAESLHWTIYTLEILK